MATKKAAVSSLVKKIETENAINLANNINGLNKYIDLATDQCNKHKLDLSNIVTLDCQTAMVEEGIAFGNYKVPLTDENGAATGEVLEVVLSVKSDELKDDELADLSKTLGVAEFDALFESEYVPVEITDAQQIVLHLSSISNPRPYFDLKSGKLSLKFDYAKGVPGIKVVEQKVPRSGFFTKLGEVMGKLQPAEHKVLADWINKRVKTAVRTGNRDN